MDAAIEAYIPLVSTPRQAIVSGKGVTGDIDVDVRSAMTLLKKQIDKSMRKVKRKNAVFFNAYDSARIIVDLGGGHAGEDSEDAEPDSPESGGTTPPPV